ncbi:MAG: hypothetical protein ACJ72O_00725 [Marmoricola sp.]
MPANAHDIKHQQIDNDIAAVYELVSKLDQRQRRHEVRFERFASDTSARFDKVDRRLGGVDGRLEGVDGRLEGIDGRLEGIDGRLEGIDGRLEGIDGRVADLAEQLVGVQAGLATVIELVSRPGAD